MSGRIAVSAGAVIYRQGSTWWTEFHQDGRRICRDLGTSDERRAKTLARHLAGESVFRKVDDTPPKEDRDSIDHGVVIFRRGKTWWIDIHQDGKRVRRSLGTSEERRAKALANELASDIVSRKWNVVEAHDLRLETAFEKWKGSLDWKNMAPGTQDNTERNLKVFINWLAGQRIVLIDRVLKEHVEKFSMWASTEYETPKKGGKK